MEQIAKLLKKPDRALESSRLLFEHEDFDAAVSRSYYAMFYAAEAALLTLSLKFSSHKGVISSFHRNFVKAGVFPNEMGYFLQNAFHRRQKGDYSFELYVDEETAQETLEEAGDFVSRVKEYLRAEGFL
jgi:uncharacterized protein (UPF0332 family)